MPIASGLRITRDLDVACTALRRGGLVGIPTETVYGLAADASDTVAIRRVYDVKQRPAGHPLILHLGDATWLQEWAVVVPAASVLAARFWPGPLTLLLARTGNVIDAVTGGRHTVAVRVPAHPMALDLLARFGRPLVAPSANRFGRVSPTTAAHVADDLVGHLDASRDVVLDGGTTTLGIESTIVDCTTPVPEVLRPGAIAASEVAAIVGDVVAGAGPARAPGMLASHYAPRADVELVADEDAARRRIAELTAAGVVARVLHNADVAQYARTLYARLREADDDDVAVIVAVLPPPEGIGAAVRDRLARASGRR